MRLIFIGPQGSGKGTQSKIIAKKMRLCHISTGDLLRAINGDLRNRVGYYINRGNLIPDDLIVKILKKRIFETDCKNGFVLDGFPRNITQVKELNKIVNIDKVIDISISDSESIRRISGRRNCSKCGAIWNINTFPKPINRTKCDKCGGDLIQRDDDKENILRKRLEIFHKNTEPILDMYDSVKVNGEQSIEKVSEDILMILR